MKLRYNTFIIAMISLHIIPVSANEEGSTMNREETNIVKTVETMTLAFHQKNITGVLTTYEDGAVVLFEPGKKVSDPVVLKQMFEGAFQINPWFRYPNGHEVYIANDIALHIAPWVMKGKSPDGVDIKQSGLSVAVLRKQHNGAWLLVLDNPHGQRLMEKQPITNN